MQASDAEEACKEVLTYEDGFGIITQRNRDGGDSAQREGMFMTFVYALYRAELVDLQFYMNMMKRFHQNSAQLAAGNGRYRRHPDGTKWYSDADNFSRDQSVAMCIAFGFVDLLRLQYFWKAHKKRGFFYQNTHRNFGRPGWKLPDIMGPSHLAQFIRGLESGWMRPFLYILDAFDTLHAVIRVVQSWYDLDHSDDLNFILGVLQAKLIWPTFWVHLTIWIYRKASLPASEGQSAHDKVLVRQENKHIAVAAFDRYFHPNWGGPPFHLIMPFIAKEYL